jgi:histidyl-tRNA synthetase
MVKRNYILQTIRKVYEKYGFQPLETPSLENLSVLTGKYGEEGDKLLFKILNSGDYLSATTSADYQAGYKDMLPKIAKKGLRYDLTVPFARYVTMNKHELTFPFRRYQIQPVWRADRPQKGRYQEFYQCDADVIGTTSLVCEAEIVAMLQEVFQSLGIGYVLKINNRKILTGFAETIGAVGMEGALFVAIDKLDKIGVEKVTEELLEKGFAASAIDQLRPFLESATSGGLEAVTTFLQGNPTGQQGLSELKQVLELAGHMGLALENVQFDLTLARGLSYYTGAIFEVKAKDVQIGSISGGGRYDNLTGVFGLPNMSGVGISFGVDRLYDVMEELQLFPEDAFVATQVMFAQFDQASLHYCLPVLQELRQKGVRAEVYPEAEKMKKQLSYANDKKIPLVVLAGEAEMQAVSFTLKDMASGQQALLTRSALVESILAQTT